TTDSASLSSALWRFAQSVTVEAAAGEAAIRVPARAAERGRDSFRAIARPYTGGEWSINRPNIDHSLRRAVGSSSGEHALLLARRRRLGPGDVVAHGAAQRLLGDQRDQQQRPGHHRHAEHEDRVDR